MIKLVKNNLLLSNILIQCFNRQQQQSNNYRVLLQLFNKSSKDLNYPQYFSTNSKLNNETNSKLDISTAEYLNQQKAKEKENNQPRSKPDRIKKNEIENKNDNKSDSISISEPQESKLDILTSQFDNNIIPGQAKIIPEGSNPDDFLTHIFDNLDPYLDTYYVYSKLRSAGFTEAQSDSIICLLIYQLNSKLSKLSTIYSQKNELESEQYLFESAQQEIRVDITRSREQHANELLALINILERDFKTISDELSNDFLVLKNDSQVVINDSKSENTLNSKKMFLRIQETNHKISSELDSALRSEIESLRWNLSRWGLITLLVGVFVSGVILKFNWNKEDKKMVKEFVPLVIREPSEYEDDDDDYHADLDRISID
ncbi:unnamed protein product [Candida verbasci]|uniref:Uncharacterized protein n=1 Tax=Candida verbasci TaxID=1227364 RepID=A0A9W4TTG8_9ASCO|nr:unnamed protein product [Candida verbasci]